MLRLDRRGWFYFVALAGRVVRRVMMVCLIRIAAARPCCLVRCSVLLVDKQQPTSTQSSRSMASRLPPLMQSAARARRAFGAEFGGLRTNNTIIPARVCNRSPHAAVTSISARLTQCRTSCRSTPGRGAPHVFGISSTLPTQSRKTYDFASGKSGRW